MRTLLNIVLPCLLTCIFAAEASGQTTAFSYQGRLTDSTLPAGGTYQMEFRLFDALAAGTQIGSTITNSSVTVANGVFTVTLDFGTSPFTAGADRWMAISVKKPAEGVFTLLAPPQQITSSPYSIKASTANGFTGSLAGDVTGTQAATVVSNVGGATAANVATGANLANSATSANTANTIVLRDGTGGFSSGSISSTGKFSLNDSFASSATASIKAGSSDFAVLDLQNSSGTSAFSVSTGAAGSQLNLNNTFSTATAAIKARSTDVAVLDLQNSSGTSAFSVSTGVAGSQLNLNNTFSTATAAIKARSTDVAVLDLQNSSGTSAFSVSTGAAGSQLNLNNTFSTATAAIKARGTDVAVLDLHNSSGTSVLSVGTNGAMRFGSLASDPAGSNGMMYYNTTSNKFRCFENSAWANCVSALVMARPDPYQQQSIDKLQEKVDQQQVIIDELRKLICLTNPTAGACKQ